MWKERNGRKYYYLTLGHGRTHYVGAGRDAELLAELVRHEAMKRIDERERLRALRDRFEATDRAVEDLCGRVEAIVAARLEAAGYRRHRGEWRRRRRRMGITIDVEPPPGEGHLVPDMEAAHAGDKAALGRLVKHFKGRPADFIKLGAGDAADVARRAVARELAGADPFMNAALLVKLRELRRELAEPGDGPLQALAVDRTATTWLACHVADVGNVLRTGTSLAEAELRDRRAERAHRRFLSSVRTLALVRKLLAPVPARPTPAPAPEPGPPAPPSRVGKLLAERAGVNGRNGCPAS
jgi:hypothetical protein